MYSLANASTANVAGNTMKRSHLESVASSRTLRSTSSQRSSSPASVTTVASSSSYVSGKSSVDYAGKSTEQTCKSTAQTSRQSTMQRDAPLRPVKHKPPNHRTATPQAPALQSSSSSPAVPSRKYRKELIAELAKFRPRADDFRSKSLREEIYQREQRKLHAVIPCREQNLGWLDQGTQEEKDYYGKWAVRLRSALQTRDTSQGYTQLQAGLAADSIARFLMVSREIALTGRDREDSGEDDLDKAHNAALLQAESAWKDCKAVTRRPLAPQPARATKRKGSKRQDLSIRSMWNNMVRLVGWPKAKRAPGVSASSAAEGLFADQRNPRGKRYMSTVV